MGGVEASASERSLRLSDLLPAPVRADLEDALSDLLAADVRLRDADDASSSRDGQSSAIPVKLRGAVVGLLEALVLPSRLRAAAALVEQVVRAHAPNAADGIEQQGLAAGESAQRALYQAEKTAAIGQLAAGVAHEINNPIGFIRSNLNTARDYVEQIRALGVAIEADRGAAWESWQRNGLAELLHDFDALLGESIGGADRVKRIVSDLKTFSGIDREAHEPLDLNLNLRVVCKVAESQLPAGAHIELDLQPLPPFACDGGRINQMLMNLVLNAVQAIAAGGAVNVSSAWSDGEIRICVQDNGCGISETHIDRVFDPFYTTRPVGGGTGLGLNVSRDIARGYGGALEITSEVGVGTLVLVRFPLTVASVTGA